MERIRRFFRRFGKGLKAKGYTLIEVAAVVAVTASLAAVVVPIAVDKTKEGKLVAAIQDCQQIGNAITGFYKDTGQWPAYSSSAPEFITTLRSGYNYQHDPINRSVWTDSHASDTSDFLENHLVVDNPGGTLGETPNRAYLQTHKLNWKGPYVGTLTKRDPWGNNYLVNIYAMYHPTTGTLKQYGWIISAGPNAKLDTLETDNKLGGDDIGIQLYAAEKGHN